MNHKGFKTENLIKYGINSGHRAYAFFVNENVIKAISFRDSAPRTPLGRAYLVLAHLFVLRYLHQ